MSAPKKKKKKKKKKKINSKLKIRIQLSIAICILGWRGCINILCEMHRNEVNLNIEKIFAVLDVFIIVLVAIVTSDFLQFIR